MSDVDNCDALVRVIVRKQKSVENYNQTDWEQESGKAWDVYYKKVNTEVNEHF